MLTLMLLRHAKAEAHGRGDDFERALTERGEADAAALGLYMAGVGLVPALALVSAARRTRTTFERFEAAVGVGIPAHIEESLYNATGDELRSVLKLVDAANTTLMVVGHNPGVMDLAILLAREGGFDDLRLLHDRFPPCALAVITFMVESWTDAQAVGGRLDLLLMPEDISHG